jgi:hypothetical protein
MIIGATYATVGYLCFLVIRVPDATVP